tara:strand:+ start:36 stop:1301 length:1266 start_codon:yes stop_codon:yes gene_type:complete
MSIESKEVRDIHALYQNLHEETARERMQKNKERVKNPLGNVTIEKEDGTKLKKGDKGFDQELEKGRKTVRDANNKSLEKDSDTVTSKGGTERTVKKNDDGKGITVTKKDLDSETEDLISNTPTVKKPTSSGSTTKKIPGEFPGTKKEFDTKYGSDEKVVRNRRGRVINNKGSLASTEKEKVVTKSDVGSDGLSSKNKKNTTQTVDVRNRRGRVTGTKEVRVQSQQSDGGKNITNRRGRVVGTTKSTDAEGKSFPSTAEIRAKAKKDGGSGLSNIPSKEGNAVINKKPLNPDFGKKPVIQKDTPVKPEISARQKWLDKTKNSPAAKAGLGDDLRWKARQNHVKFQKDNNRGPFRDPNKKAGGRKFNPSNKVTSVMDMESYDAYDLVLDYLLETNQVDTIEEANYVMIQMDESTIQGIVNEYA